MNTGKTRTDLEIKRLRRLKKGEIIHIIREKKIMRVKIVKNYRNMKMIEYKLPWSFLDAMFLSGYTTREAYPYDSERFDITLNEDLI